MPLGPWYLPPPVPPQSAQARQADINRLSAQGYMYGYTDTGFRPQMGKNNLRAVNLLDYMPIEMLLRMKPEAIAALLNTTSVQERTPRRGVYHRDSRSVGIDPSMIYEGSPAAPHEGLHALEDRSFGTRSMYSGTGLMPGAPSLYLESQTPYSEQQQLGRQYFGREGMLMNGAEYLPMLLQNQNWNLDALPENLRGAYDRWFLRSPRTRR